MKMHSLKLKYERYNKQFKYLVYITLTLIAFNILYLQNNLIIKWMYKNSEFHIARLKNDFEYRSLSEDEIDFWGVSIHAEDITKSNLNIFFIETTCCTKNARSKYEFERNGMILSIRQACAIESTAYLNKNHTIYLLYSCPINENIFKKTSKEIIQIFCHSNVKIVKLCVYKYFEGTPVEDLLTKGVLDESNYPVEHTSDVLRFLTLWKYGGSYIDLDVISTRSLYELRADFAAYETKTAIGSAVINFKSNGIGYKLLTEMLYYLKRFFDGTKWSNNGPDLVTKTLLNLCNNGQKIEENNKIICDGFTIYQPEVFYPLPWNEWEMYFQENNTSVTLQRIKNSFVVHFWNKKSHKVKVYVGSKQPYEILAEKYCQLVHSAVKMQNYSSY